MALCWRKRFQQRSDREVMLVLCDFANDEGICWPSRGTVAWKTDLSETTLKAAYSRLRECEAIVILKDASDGTVPILQVRPEVLPNKPPQEGGKPVNPLGVKPVTPKPSIEPSGNKPPKGGTDEPVPDDDEFQAWHIKEYIRAELDQLDYEYTRPSLQPYSWAASRLHKRGTDPEDLYEAADRVIAEWPRIRLKLDDALKDIRNDAPNGSRVESKVATTQNGNGTPPEAIDYVFDNAAGEYFRNNESRIRRAMEKHDFTGHDSPAYPIQKMLGGTDQEIWLAMDGLESLLGRWKRGENHE